ncbi:MAG: tRNA lysidine(34) synthetase TilS [Actinobacteria bacterium]|nr:MAG: tRNA lysidine(34) synthetase TilS [Actinomycetota bacterium]
MSDAGAIVAAARRVIAGRPVVAALGGGADSAVACWAAVESGSEVRAVFVDHGLSGSHLLDRATEALSTRLRIVRTVLPGPVGHGPDLENRARSIRHSLLLGHRNQGESVVTGHTRTDQAETVLLQLLRGAGARGLSAMSEQDGTILRPLLAFSRSEIRATAVAAGLPFADDPANDDDGFTRNRLRAEVMPLLEAIRPGSEAAIARAARSLAADDGHLKKEAQAVPMFEDDGAVLLPLAALAVVDRAVAARAVLAALRRLGGDAGNGRDVDVALGAVATGRRRAQLSAGRLLEIEGPYLAIFSGGPLPPGETAITIPGDVVFGTHRLRIGDPVACSGRGLALDGSRLPGTLTVRAVRAGDRIAIRDGSKLVNDALAEAGIPARVRPAWPVLVAGAKIAAVPGARVAWWARATGGETLTLIDERVPG